MPNTSTNHFPYHEALRAAPAVDDSNPIKLDQEVQPTAVRVQRA